MDTSLSSVARYLAFALLLSAAPQAVLAQAYVFGRAEFPTDPNSTAAAVATGDFNGDGIPDLAVCTSDNTVSIYLGKPDGSFSAKIDYPVGNRPRFALVGDFNGDGNLDLVVVNANDNTVSILLGNGDGTFQAHTDFATGSNPYSVAASDFNADGKLDLAVANSSDSTVSVLLGNGDGTFQNHKDYKVNPFPVSVVAGDFNGDGKQDLVVADGNSLSLLAGNGDGTFGAQTSLSVALEPLVVADFNGDGKPDLAGIGPGTVVSVLIGNGDGTFQPPVSYGTGTAPEMCVAADLNGDGHVDLVTASGYLFSVLIGNGDGTFQPSLDYASPNADSLAVADYNGDGHLDLAIFGAGTTYGVIVNTFSVLLGAGDGTFMSRKDYAAGGGQAVQAVSVTIGDFNGDGNPDLAVPNSNNNAGAGPGTVSILLGNGDGTFQPHVDYATGADPIFTVTGDFNGDHKTDLAILNYQGNTVSILLGNGDGTFQPAKDFAAGYAPNSVVVGDFNRDGKQDLAISNYNGDILLLGNGDGTFQAPTGLGVFGGSLVAADFNGDGALDLAGVNFLTDEVSILLGKGDGTFQPPSNYPAGNITPQGITVGDFNNDGKLDLVAVGGGASILLGNGDGTFGNPSIIQSASFAYSASTGDINNDGNLDLLLPGGFILGNGDGTFQPETLLAAAFITGLGHAGDFNHDGNTDIVEPDQVLQAVSVFLNAPAVALFPRAVVFTDQPVGVPSGVKQVTLSNPSVLPLSITTIVTSGDFTQTNNCPLAGTKLSPGSKCTISLTFNPALAGKRSGTLTITDKALGSPQVVKLVGNPPALTLSSSSLSFLSQPIATTSAPQLVTLTNPGDSDVNIEEIAVGKTNSADFAEKNNCGSSVAAHSSCLITVTFTPQAAGVRRARVTIFDDASNSPQVVALTGNAHPTTITLILGVNPSSWNQKAAFSATVSSQFNGTPTGTVTIMDGNIALVTAVLDSIGAASLTTSSLGVGAHNLTAVYSGDDTFYQSTSSSQLQVVDRASAGTSISLTAGTNPSSLSQTLTFTATVSPQFGGLPTGTVTFVDNTTVLGTGTASMGGIWSFAASSLSPGPHAITAMYQGDSNVTPSTSPVFCEVVESAGTGTKTTLAVNGATGTVIVSFRTLAGAQGANFEVTVAGSSNGDLVVLLDGNMQLGAALILNSGQTNYTSQLPAGAHSIQAVYIGNGTAAGSASPVVIVERSPWPRPR